MEYGDYEYYYNCAKNKYYDACSEINSCENRKRELNNQRQERIRQLNELKTELKNNKKAFEKLSKIANSGGNLNERLSQVKTKTSDAAANYSSMVSSTAVTNKDLNDVYSQETVATKNAICNLFDVLKARRDKLNAKIEELQQKLSQAETDLRNIESSIRSNEDSLWDWKRVKSNASFNMEYYRRKMNSSL